MSAWENIEEITEKTKGFVYLIVNLETNKLYVGKKQTFSKTSTTVAGRKNKKWTIKPSNWRAYYGSCKPLSADIKKLGKHKFRRIILGAFNDLNSVNYAEAELQFVLGVLADKANGFEYYNGEIRIRVMKFPTNREYIKRVQEILKGLKC